jgi:hypothetical protein
MSVLSDIVFRIILHFSAHSLVSQSGLSGGA